MPDTTQEAPNVFSVGAEVPPINPAVGLAVGAAIATETFFTSQHASTERPKSVDEMMARTTIISDRLALNMRSYEAYIARHARKPLIPSEWPADAYGPADSTATYDNVKVVAEGKRLTVWINADSLVHETPETLVADFDPVSPRPEHLRKMAREVAFTSVGEQCFRVTELLASIHPSPSEMHIRIFLNDLDSDGRVRNDTAAREFRLRRIIEQGSTAYSRLAILKASEYIPRLEAIIEDLAYAGNGTVVRRGNSLFFEPASWMGRWSILQYGDKSEMIGRALLKHEGSYGNQLIRMAPFLDRQNDSDMHVLLGGINSGERTIETLLRAGEYHRPDGGLAFSGDHMHTFSFSSSADLPYRSAHRIAWLLSTQVHEYRKSLRATPFNRLQVEGEEGYLPRNYDEIRPQDQRIIRAQLMAEARLAHRQGIDPYDPESLFKAGEVMHVCVGANPYTGMLSSIYSHPNEGAVIGWDIAPKVIEYNNSVREDPTYDLARRQMWHQEIMAAVRELSTQPEFKALELTEELFRNLESVTRQQLRVVRGDIKDLPQRAFKRVYMHFGAEAAARSRVDYTEYIRKIANSLNGGDARLIMVLTEKSKPLWPGGKRKLFPAYSAEMEKIELVLLDCGLEIEHMERLDNNLPDDQKLRAGENFVLVTAKLRPRSISSGP